MELMTVAAIISPLISSFLSIGGFVYWWGKRQGKIEKTLNDHETRITEQENKLQQENGRPIYITRSEFDQDWKPYIVDLKDSIEVINGRIGRIEAHLGVYPKN